MPAESKRPAILVVDDEPLVLMLALDLIDALGFEGIAAADADAAISILEHDDEVRAVFTDVNMPGSMDGVGLACAVKTQWPALGILVTSGRPLQNPAALPAGSCFLRKPYSLRALEHCLHELFD